MLRTLNVSKLKMVVVRTRFGVWIALLFFGTLFWAESRDPFQRLWFQLNAPLSGQVDCVAVLPKNSARPLPLVIYLHGSSGSLVQSGKELRKIAEMGLAAVGIDYCQTNETIFDQQFQALLSYLSHQKWTDVKRSAWAGYSLGARRLLSFYLRQRSIRPSLFVQVAGGSVPELEESSTYTSRTGNGGKKIGEALILHGESDATFSVTDARRVAELLQITGISVLFKVFPGEDHRFDETRLLLCRAIGEYCLTHLDRQGSLRRYRSILSWRARSYPLWVFWMPALLWGGACLHWPRSTWARWINRYLGILGVVVVATAAFFFALHRLSANSPVGKLAFEIARSYLVASKDRQQFEFLVKDPIFHGKPLMALVDHVGLARYNQTLTNSKLDPQMYERYVLSPSIDPVYDGDLRWRRELWENFFPRVRKELSPSNAACVVARFLRERVSKVSKEHIHAADFDIWPQTIAEIWQQQIADENGFEATYVASLRSVGIPARLDVHHRAEIWNGSEWGAAPRPPIECCF